TYPDRGAGYNVIDNGTAANGANGTCENAGSQYGIFPNRVGWPEIVQVANGDQLVFAHTPIKMMRKAASVSGTQPNDWTYVANPFGLATGATTFVDTWPRAVASGNIIHMIATCSGCTVTDATKSDVGVEAPIRYFRSQDGGTTWDKVDQTLPGLTTATFPEGIGADAYAIHTNGSNVAIIAGDGGSDWMMWKSSDNGDNWTNYTMRHFRGAIDTVDFFGVTDSPDNVQYISNDRFMSVVVTNSGEAHAFAGEQVVVVDRDSVTFKNRYYPGLSQGLWHWSTTMTPGEPEYVDIELEDLADYPTMYTPEDTALWAETSGNYQSGYIGMPTAAVDQNNWVYVVYSKALRGTDSNGDPATSQNYRNLYGTALEPGSMTFKSIQNLGNALTGNGPGEFEESVFPSIVTKVGSDDMIHMIYQNDDEPGLRIQADYDGELLNRMVYAGFSAAILRETGISEDMKTLASGITVMPNPTSNVANVKVDLLKDAKVGVKVYNLLGQEVISIPAADFFVANNNVVELDLSAQPTGMYLL
ncbi:MAG: T9SS type A sorting domain-containing protein, partial [Sphingobacteriales bacterium]